MNVIEQSYETLKGGDMTIPVLLLLFAVVMGWFPGHNARCRNHPQANRVNTTSWCLIFVSVAITICGLLQAMVGPLLVAAWVAIATWSYGRSSALRKATVHRYAFEVISPASSARAIPLDGDIASPAVGS